MSRWKYKVIPAGSYILKELLVPIFIRGEQVYEEPTLDEIRAYCAEQLRVYFGRKSNVLNILRSIM